MRISDWSSDVCSSDRAALVDRLADHVHDATKRFRADRHADLRAGVGDLLTPDKAVGAIHGDGADGVLAEMLGDFENEAVAAVVGLERRQNRRKIIVERNVDDGADHLSDAADIVRGGRSEEHTSELQSLMRISYAVF